MADAGILPYSGKNLDIIGSCTGLFTKQSQAKRTTTANMLKGV